MQEVYCECNCKWADNNICSREYIAINPVEGCVDWEEVPKKECPDKYYAFCIDHEEEIPGKKVARCWQPRTGIKAEFLGREVFLDGYDDNVFTDGRTGVSGSKKSCEKKSKEEMDKIFADLEESNGISPLYTDNPKWPIKEKSLQK